MAKAALAPVSRDTLSGCHTVFIQTGANRPGLPPWDLCAWADGFSYCAPVGVSGYTVLSLGPMGGGGCPGEWNRMVDISMDACIPVMGVQYCDRPDVLVGARYQRN